MMELNLTRVDYTQVGVTSKKSMRLLPTSGKVQKIAIADHDGILQLFGMKKGDVQHVFKTSTSTKLARLELGGPVGGVRERIFVSSAAVVKGYTKKGKNFLTFDTNMSEPILSMYVEGADLFTCSNFVFNHYHDCKDANSFVCADNISDVICLPANMVDLTPVLACQDRVLRIIQGSNLLYEVEVPGPPVTLSLYGNNGGDEANEILYGTSDGRVGLVQIGKLAPSHRWELPNEKRNGGVLCIDNFDITADGVLDLLIGRDDGQVEVYSYDDSDEPIHRYSHTCNESITSIQGGVVASAGFDEIVCATYAVLLFRTTFAESSQSIAQTVTESVIPVSSSHISAGASKDLDLFSGNQLLQNLTLTRNTTHRPITSTSHELSPLHTSALLSTLLSVDTNTKMTPLYAPSSPFLTSVDMQSSSHTIVNVYTDTGPISNLRTSTESQSNMTTVSSRGMNSSITSGFVQEFQDRNTSIGIMSTVTKTESFASYSVRQESEMVKTSLRFPPESGQANANTDSSAVTHNLATDSYRTQSQNVKASDITEMIQFTRQKVLRPSIISLLASSLTNNTFVPTETSSSPSPSSSTSFSSLATTTLPYDLAITSNTYSNELNSMLDRWHDSHADMTVSSISPTEVIREAKTNPHLHSSLVRNDLLLDANAVISTSQAQTRSTSSSNEAHDMTPSSSVYTRSPSNESHDMAHSSSEYTRSPKLFSPATSLQPSPTVSAVNKYTTTITVNLPPIQERNDGQHLIKGISSPLTHTQSRQSNETITHSSTIISGSNDSSSLSSILLDRNHPYINQTLSITPKSKVLPTSAGPALSSSLAEFALTTVGITSQSNLMSADKRATDGTASSVQQVDRFPHPTHEETINQPCTNVDKTASVELESTSTDSLFKSLKYDLRFAITFQGDCEVMTDDSKLQEEFWEAIISLICGTLNLPENTVQPEDIICPPLRVYFTLKQITRIDAFEVLNYTISNNSFQVPIIADSVPVIYRGQSIQRLESTSDRPDRSVTTLERLDIIIISIAGVLFFVLLVACSCICCREMYRRKHVQSFKLKETPHVSVKVEDYTLTRIPRTKVIYTDSHMLTEEDLGVNHDQIESRSKENGDHHLNESLSTTEVDRYQNESESTVNGDHRQNESGSKVNSDHHLDESKVKVTGDYHHQNESGSKVNGDPVEGRENEINQDSIMIKVRSHADGIVIGVTCSPSQIPKVTKPLSDCLAPTENNLSGGSSDSLIEKTEGEDGLSNPNCLADDERYAGHTSPEEDEELL